MEQHPNQPTFAISSFHATERSKLTSNLVQSESKNTATAWWDNDLDATVDADARQLGKSKKNQKRTEQKFHRLCNKNKNKVIFSHHSHHQLSSQRRRRPRTARQWLYLVIFYIGLYASVLTLPAAIYLGYFFYAYDLEHPHRSYLILTEPALNYRPEPVDPYSTLIQYNRNDRAKFLQLYDSIDSVVKHYEAHFASDPNENLIQEHEITWTKDCSFDNPVDNVHACRINTQRFGTFCYHSMEYGIADGAPCFLIRINRVHSWIPEPYDSFEELKAAGFPLDWSADFDRRYMPITCIGANNVDDELLGPLEYIYPYEDGKRGIPTYFFPYRNQLNYQSPGVMVHLVSPTWSVVIRIVCHLWARNVPYDITGAIGGVRFEVMIDNGIVAKWQEDPEYWTRPPIGHNFDERITKHPPSIWRPKQCKTPPCKKSGSTSSNGAFDGQASGAIDFMYSEER